MVNYIKKLNTIMEVRTGFVASSCALIGICYGYYSSSNVNILASLFLLISAFSFNIVANVAAEIKGYLSKEDENNLTGHSGSEGLTRGDITLKEAYFGLIITSLLAITSGMLALIFSQKLILLLIGGLGFITAICYSLTPLAFNKYPVGEFMSGLMCGYLCTIAGIIIQMDLTIASHLLAIITFFMVSFLMAANNTVDYNKDLKTRTTFAHVVGFRKSITLLIPQIFIVFGLWIIIFGLDNNVITFIVGLFVLVYFGLFKWYFKYYKVNIDTPNLAKIYGPKPLVLLLSFNVIMSITFILIGVLCH